VLYSAWTSRCSFRAQGFAVKRLDARRISQHPLLFNHRHQLLGTRTDKKSFLLLQMNKTALITGSSTGIGHELAKIHAEKGDNLVLVARSKNKLDELKNLLEGKHKVLIHTIGKDLSQPGAAKEVYDQLKHQAISIDYLINNAGVGDFGLFAESDWNKQETMINLNIAALTHFTWLFLPDMIHRGSGKIMNVASTASFQPGPTMSVYFASKAYVLSFSEAVNNEVRDKGITVTALCPGSTESGFHAATLEAGTSVKVRRKPSSKQVAAYGYLAMMKGQPVAIHGLKNKIIATLVRFLPRSLVVKTARKIQESKY
jgi:short-subunit dehydrogenase